MEEKPTVTLQNGHRSVSPVHIHLTDTTPLHVHVSKPTRPSHINYLPNRSRLRNDSRLLEKISQQRGTSTLNKTLNRQLSTQTASRSRRSQPAASQRKLKELKESEDALRDKERQLEQFEKKLLATDMENKKILENIENICTALENSNDSAAAADKHHRDLAMEPDVNQLGRYQLLLQALALKIDDFTTLLKNIKEDMLFNSSPAMTEVQMDHLMTQKKLLERDLRRFDEVFSFLRREMIRLLEERPNFIQLNVERDDLLNKVHKLSRAHEILQADLKKMSLEKNEVLSELETLKSEHLQNVNSMESLKQTKAHLQRELTNKESELSRLTSKVKNLETSLHVEKSLKEELKEKVNVDKENFKKAARLHKMRADKNESNLANAQTALVEKNSEVEKLVEQINSMKLQMAKMAKEKMMAVAELDNAKSVQQKRKSSAGGDADADDNDDNSSKKLKEIKKALKRAEASLRENENESNRLKAKLGNSEHAIEDYKMELSKHKLEIERLRQELLNSRLDKDAEYNKLLKEVEMIDLNKRLQQQPDNSSTSNKELADKVSQLERKLSMLEEENRELNIASARREESLKQTNLRLEEKINEGLMMQRQIDNMMLEARKMKDHESNRMTSADQANQVQMLEMECQLNQLRHEVNKLKREKEEAERRLNQRTMDMKDRLEQSCSTNRTLQNYIHFLKNSYACAFNDSPHITSLSHLQDLNSRDFLAGDFVGNVGSGAGNIF